MTLLWPWALICLLPIAAAAVLSLRRPLQQLVPVGSLSLWERALATLGPKARRSRRVSAAWLVLLAGGLLAAGALARPTYHAAAPARRIALSIYPSADLAWRPEEIGENVGAFLARLNKLDQVQLVLPAILGGPGRFLLRDEAARLARQIRPLPVPADKLSLPAGGQEVQHLYRFAPATLPPVDGPRTTTISLPARPGDVTIDAFAVAAAADGDGQVEAFVAVRSHAAEPTSGEVLLGREDGPPLHLRFDLPARGGQAGLPTRRRAALLGRLPGGGQWYWAWLAGSANAGGRAFVAGRRLSVARIALLGRDEPSIRRFVEVDPALRLVGDAAEADVVVAVGAAPPAEKPALVIDPPAPPPGWGEGTVLSAVALRDAAKSDSPLLADVSFDAVAVRKLAGWRPRADSSLARLLTLNGQAVLLAGGEPPRVYMAFDLAGENTNFAVTPAFVIFMDNAMGYLAPRARARTSYEYLTPLQAAQGVVPSHGGGRRQGTTRDWQPLPDRPGLPPLNLQAPVFGRSETSPAPGPAPAGSLCWPGLYRDAAGAIQAVSLPALQSAEPKTPASEQIQRAPLPAPRPMTRGLELWPVLLVLAVGCWLTGWALRLR